MLRGPSAGAGALGVRIMSLVETRELRFGQLALRFALAHAGGAAEQVGLPKGVPEAVRFVAEAQAVTARFGGAEERQLDSAALGLVLVAYCLRARIPLPRRATKSVRVLPDAVVLTTRLEHELPPEPVAADRTAAPKPDARRQMVWGR
jgi:hypothetical protein